MDGAAGKAKLESLSVNDKITVEGRGSWYNGFQVTALDADKIVVIADGRVKTIGTKEDVLPELLHTAETCQTLVEKI